MTLAVFGRTSVSSFCRRAVTALRKARPEVSSEANCPASAASTSLSSLAGSAVSSEMTDRYVVISLRAPFRASTYDGLNVGPGLATRSAGRSVTGGCTAANPEARISRNHGACATAWTRGP